MKKLYTIAAFALALSLCTTAQAVDRPKTPAGAPTNGGQYILVNAYTPTGYMSRTSWDGALYFLGESDSNYANYAFTAQKNDDDTWSFYIVAGTATDGTDSLNYMAVPDGTGNVNIKNPTLTKWTLNSGDFDNYYRLTAGEGNTAATQGLNMHLNAGGQYFVISEEVNGGGWYPDYAGGAIAADNDYGYEVDENGRAIMADKTSENWAFIQTSDVPEYMALYSAYNAIKNLEDNYLEVEGYEAGFQATDAAALALYNSADFNWEEDPATIQAMITQKINLYQAIEDAKALENPDATLTAAITSAETSFQTVTGVSEIVGVITALNNAVNAFKEGSGDVTGLGTNMSFEDLSAQDGSETSGVAAPPVGWNVYINGVQVTTADEVRSNGITAWHGVNSDCDGDGKDGNVGFGIWTSGIPTYEISQEISGLDNGTYVVSAGLMVGANGSGSRRTTQRIFGNLNSEYFASAEEYDASLLDQSEVYDFADLVEPTTDRQLQPISVRAYVYDGTLTFGVRTDGNYQAALRSATNSAGGDGWFKVDNFTIQKEGYVGADAAAVANHFINAYADLQGQTMQSSLAEEIQDILSQYNTVSADADSATINTIIRTLSGRLADVQASVEAYAALVAAVEEGYNNAEEYRYYSGYDAYIALVEEAGDAYDDAEIGVDEINALIQGLKDGLIELQKSGIAVGEYMSIIQNSSFEDLSAQGNSNSDGVANPPAGWTLAFNGTVCASSADYSAAGASMGWCAINSGDAITETDQNGTEWTTQYTDGTHLWGIWAGNMPEVELSQSFTGIPAGTYVLSCDMVVQYNWGGPSVTTQRIFANDYIQMYGAEETYAARANDTDDMAAARALDEANPDADLKHMNYAGWLNDVKESYTSCPHAMSLTFGVDEGGDLKIGFRTNNVDPDGTPHPYDSAGWFKLDNFKLFYQSADIPTGIRNTSDATANANQLLRQEYFTVGGAKVSAPQKGITIVKNIMSDGSVKTTKVLK